MESEKDKMRLTYCSIDASRHFPVGALPLGARLLLSAHGENISELTLVLTKDGELPVEYVFAKDGDDFCLTLDITSSGLYFYIFQAFDGIKTESFGRDSAQCAVSGGQPFVQLVYRYFPRSDLLGSGPVYQIFPDRFAVGGKRLRTKPDDMKYRDDWGGIPEFLPEKGIVRNNDMFGGNLRGIIEKLDYLKDLGVTCLYLNPIFEAYSNHKYNTADYLKIDSDFGTEEELAELVREGEKRNISVILDGVFSHTGDDSIYFDKKGRFGTGACVSKDSKYFDWYSFDEYPEKYKCWWGIETLPNVNETIPSYMEFITEKVVKKWLRFGIKGFRLDVADELPDEFLDALFSCVYGKEFMLIGEVWENAATKISYGRRRRYFLGGQLDGVTNYPLGNAVIEFIRRHDASALNSVVCELVNDYPAYNLNNSLTILSTHDTVRVLNALSDQPVPAEKSQRAVAVLSDANEAKRRLKLAAGLQYTLPGVPCVFYGDEVGIQGYEDPFCRACFPWNDMDSELLEYYKRLGLLRKNDVFNGGDYCSVEAKEGLFIFSRVKHAESLLIIANAGDTISLEKYKSLPDIFNGNEFSGVAEKYGFYVLATGVV